MVEHGLGRMFAKLSGIAFAVLFLINCSEMETKWVRKFNALGPGNYRINSIVSSKEAIYFAGTYSEQEGISRCFIAKYNTKGEAQWHKIYETSQNTRAQGKMLLVIRTQEELLTTRSDIFMLIETHDANGLKRAILAKYDTLGNLAWQKIIITNEGELTSTLLSDSEGNLYVAGWEVNSEGRATIFFAKYAESGETVWSTKYYSEELDFDEIRFDIMDPEYFVLAGLRNNTGELFCMKYDGSGQFQGMINYSPETEVKALSDLKVAPNGNIFLSANTSNAGTDGDFLTIAFDVNDSLLWANTFDGEMHGNDHCSAIAVDESLNVYVTGSTENAGGIPNIVTVKYDKSGNRIWTQSIGQNKASNSLIIEPRYLRLGRRPYQAYLYIAGVIGSDALILRCNANGVYSFQAQYGERGELTMPTALSEKCMALERTTETGSDAFIAKYGPSTILGVARWD